MVVKTRLPDVLPAALVTGLSFWEMSGGEAFRGSPAGNAAVIVVIGATLLFRRSRPAPAAAVLATAVALQALLWRTPESAGEFLAILLMVFSVGAHARGRARSAGLTALVVANVIALARDPLVETFADALPGFAIGLAAYFVGELFGRRTEQADRAEAARATAEAQRDSEAREAVARERARIAREIHDVIAHGLGAIVVQSGAARLDAQDPGVAEKLLVVERTARQSLLELRRLLGILRRADDETPLAPQPGIAGLGELANNARASGLEVHLVVDGAGDGLAPGLELCAYRIVQESLTNVVRHAGASSCEVRVRHDPGCLTVEVTDDGAGANGSPGGFGILGMRERVQVYGGTMEAGPRPGGGFAVRARLPTDAVGAP